MGNTRGRGKTFINLIQCPAHTLTHPGKHIYVCVWPQRGRSINNLHILSWFLWHPWARILGSLQQSRVAYVCIKYTPCVPSCELALRLLGARSSNFMCITCTQTSMRTQSQRFRVRICSTSLKIVILNYRGQFHCPAKTNNCKWWRKSISHDLCIDK